VLCLSQLGEYSRVEHLAKAFFFSRWKEAYMAMFTVYFDASGHPDGTSVFSVAGFIANAQQWIDIQDGWESVLARYEIHNGLHMKEYSHSVGEYAKWKEDRPKHRQFLIDLIAVIVPHVQHSFACSIDLDDYRRIDKELRTRKFMSPLALAGGRCIANVRKWAEHERVHPDSILYIFEDGDIDKTNLIRSVEHDFGFTPLFQPKGKSSALQAADLIAYEQRLIAGKIFNLPDPNVLLDMHDLRKSLQAIYHTPHFVDGNDSWVVFEKPNLEAGFRHALTFREEIERQRSARKSPALSRHHQPTE
jgi:hypothetical protein